MQRSPLSDDGVKGLFSDVPSGVALLAARVEGKTTAMVVSTLTVGVSLDPPMVTAAIAHTSTSWPVLEQASAIGISVLSTENAESIPLLRSRDEELLSQELHGFSPESSALVLPDASVTMCANLVEEYPAGDHRIALFHVLDYARPGEHPPLVYHRSRFHQVGAEIPREGR
ncbi:MULTISPECIES: flavin reductase family protein [unclassified Corynebacterium]|uniref:flavin reductase family protein n=1 Tax=unclassified Corynebacterium TaxID=2624378 RepID=UPI0029CA7683|nr:MULTISPECIES: flavin reductase family protein [unclassified Corynebacterium]WPF65783.1 flavin reductase family protein [Corynebacterium sp. 22KM0430]WPF68277.1 flavin reductase family protein [Corynebacterium sp. 21KM1197]